MSAAQPSRTDVMAAQPSRTDVMAAQPSRTDVMAHPVAEKLDALMALLMTYIRDVCHVNGS